jgi:serine/threonine protein phosphatase 1
MYLIIGDIHGEITPLKNFIDDLKGNDYTLIFLGDYINKGKNSREVIDLLIETSKQYNCVFLEGNHEAHFERFIKSGGVYNFLEVGGANTLLSYKNTYYSDVHKEFIDSFPERHASFFAKLEKSIVVENYFISHLGIKGMSTLDELQEAIKKEGKEYKYVCGHYLQKNKQPYFSERLICLDTGCGALENGVLSVLSISDLSIKQYKVT